MTGKNKIKFCLVGAGRMGVRWAKIIGSSPQAELSFVVDNNLDSAKRAAEVYKAGYSDHWNVKDLKERGIKAFLVATPHKYLAVYAANALAAGIHVLVEKPGATSVEEMQNLLRLSKSHKAFLMVGFNYRFFDAIARAKKIVDSGKIGKVNFIRIQHGHGGRSGYGREWRMNKAMAGGGVLMDQGVHLLDLVNYFFASPVTKALGVQADLYWRAGVEDNAFAILQNNAGQVASLHVSLTQWKPLFSLDIYGARGYCSVNGLGKKYGGSEILTVGIKDKNDEIKETVINCNPDAENSLRLELAEFVKAVRKRKTSSPNGQDALAVLNIVKKIYSA